MIINNNGKSVYVNIYTLSLAATHLVETGWDFFNKVPNRELILTIIEKHFNFQSLELLDNENDYHTMGINQENGWGSLMDELILEFKLTIPDKNTVIKEIYDYEKDTKK
jgi:hypothetical protein